MTSKPLSLAVEDLRDLRLGHHRRRAALPSFAADRSAFAALGTAESRAGADRRPDLVEATGHRNCWSMLIYDDLVGGLEHFLFSPTRLGMMIQSDCHIFRGSWNHQLVIHDGSWWSMMILLTKRWCSSSRSGFFFLPGNIPLKLRGLRTKPAIWWSKDGEWSYMKLQHHKRILNSMQFP